uniref:Uncharacterized protein n=1 Tax=Setaria italica TaxID=4555 RepID=K4AP34_SETIT
MVVVRSPLEWRVGCVHVVYTGYTFCKIAIKFIVMQMKIRNFDISSSKYKKLQSLKVKLTKDLIIGWVLLVVVHTFLSPKRCLKRSTHRVKLCNHRFVYTV